MTLAGHQRATSWRPRAQIPRHPPSYCFSGCSYQQSGRHGRSRVCSAALRPRFRPATTYEGPKAPSTADASKRRASDWLYARQASVAGIAAAVSVVVNGPVLPSSYALQNAHTMQPARPQPPLLPAQIMSEASDLLRELFVDARSKAFDWDALYEAAVNEVTGGAGADDAIRHLLDKLGDHWTRLVPPQDNTRLQMETTGQVVHVGLRLESSSQGLLQVAYVAPGSAADHEGILSGDQVLDINGQPASSLDKGRLSRMLRQECSLKLRRMTQGSLPQDLQIDLRAQAISSRPVSFTSLPGESGSVGYIRIKAFGHSTAAATESAIRKLQAQGASHLVVDLRGNPGGLVQAGYEIAGLLLDPGEVFCYITNLTGPEHATLLPSDPTLTSSPLVVLVNGGTASTSEVLSAALQAQHRALLLGEHTFGKGRTQRVLPLQDGSTLLVSNALLTSPAHTAIDKVGLEPDVACKPQNDDFQSWNDDSTDPATMIKDRCLQLAIQHVSQATSSGAERLSPAVTTASALPLTAPPLKDDEPTLMQTGAAWRQHVMQLQMQPHA